MLLNPQCHVLSDKALLLQKCYTQQGSVGLCQLVARSDVSQHGLHQV